MSNDACRLCCVIHSTFQNLKVNLKSNFNRNLIKMFSNVIVNVDLNLRLIYMFNFLLSNLKISQFILKKSEDINNIQL
jgi:hypothetical protein